MKVHSMDRYVYIEGGQKRTFSLSWKSIKLHDPPDHFKRTKGPAYAGLFNLLGNSKGITGTHRVKLLQRPVDEITSVIITEACLRLY